MTFSYDLRQGGRAQPEPVRGRQAATRIAGVGWVIVNHPHILWGSRNRRHSGQRMDDRIRTGDDKIRGRILHSASQLFFHQGYHRTTLQQVLNDSRITEEEFQRHFQSLDDLHHAFLRHFDESESQEIIEFVEERSTPLTRFMGVIEALRPWMVERNFRGCLFINTISEFPDPESTPRQIGTAHYDRLRELIRRLTIELRQSEPEKYRHLHVDQITEEYLLIMTGTIAMGSLYHSEHSMAAAVRSVRRLLSCTP